MFRFEIDPDSCDPCTQGECEGHPVWTEEIINLDCCPGTFDISEVPGVITCGKCYTDHVAEGNN